MGKFNDLYRRLVLAVIVFGLAFLLVALLSLFRESKGLLDLLRGNYGSPEQARNEQVNEVRGLTEQDVPLLTRVNQEIEKIYDKVSPTVVSITAEFGGGSAARVIEQGSGVIVTEDGLVVTNYHVIVPKRVVPDRMQIELIDGSVYEAKLIGSDEAVDLALLRIVKESSDETFEPIAFGDSDDVRVGHRVFAFGNPYQLGVSQSEGNVAATDRFLNEMQHDVFQITAPVNPGQSGGPLVNIRGELIGINTAIFSEAEQFAGFQGIAFSIRGNEVRDTVLAIRDGRRPVWGYLGVDLERLSDSKRKALNYSKKNGALVKIVAPNSPAQKAGLKTQDIISKFDGKNVAASYHLFSLLKRSANKSVDLSVWREGKEVKLTVSVLERSKVVMQPSNLKADKKKLEILFNKIGIYPIDISAKEKQEGLKGVRVSRIVPGSLAEERHIKPGDYIVIINGARVTDLNFFISMLKNSIGSRRTELIVERPSTGTLRVSLPQVRLK